MKFGKYLRRHEATAGPYAGQYVAYKLLKQALKRLVEGGAGAARGVGDDGAAEFHALVLAEAAKVDATYNARLAELARVLAPALDGAAGVDVAEFGENCKKLDELRAYSLLNYMAVCKIMKKHDKKAGRTDTQAVLAAVQQMDFYQTDGLASLLTRALIVGDVMSGAAPDRDEFTCALCLGVLSNPVVLSCAHRYCWQCLARAAQFGEACPTCRKEVALDPRHYSVDRTLQAFLVSAFPGEVSAEPDGFWAAELHTVPSDDSDDEDDDCGAGKAAGDHDMGVKEAAPMPRPPRTPPSPAQTPPYPVAVSSFSDVLVHAWPGSYVVLDVDETLVMAPTPTAMFSPRGVAVFQRELRMLNADPDAKREYVRLFQSMLDRKELVEGARTADVVRELRERGCWVFGLTARYSHMAPRTRETLDRTGLHMVGAGGPPHVAGAAQDPDTGALWCEGVVYTNATDKGTVLDRFLRHVVCMGSHAPLPPSIVFVDDRAANCESVQRGLPLAAEHGVPVMSLHYTGAEVAYGDAAHGDDRVLSHQAGHFFRTSGGLLSDEDARAAVSASDAAAAASSSGCSV